MSISSTEYDWLLRELRDIGTPELLSRVERFRLPAVSESLSSLADGARRIAATLGKSDINVMVQDDGLRLDSESWRPFFSNAIHVVRNAIDHGIEAAEERASNGKRGAGTLVLRQTQSDTDVVFEISDDGRGIDWAAIAERAKEMGMAHETEEDLCDAVFTDGLSTRARATETSGRGVGVGAFRRVVEGLSGRVEVESRAGRGTCIRAIFPMRAITSAVE